VVIYYPRNERWRCETRPLLEELFGDVQSALDRRSSAAYLAAVLSIACAVLNGLRAESTSCRSTMHHICGGIPNCLRYCSVQVMLSTGASPAAATSPYGLMNCLCPLFQRKYSFVWIVTNVCLSIESECRIYSTRN